MKKFIAVCVISILPALGLAGCASSYGPGNAVLYKPLNPEPDWIRNGEPIEFEGELWYPRDTLDILTDEEVSPLGTYRGVQYYLQKIDVKPYNRIYTKFGKNQFRVFESKSADDKSQRAF